MRSAPPSVLGRTLRRMLVPAAAMLMLACEDSTLLQEPQPTEEPAGGDVAGAVEGDRPWADGYVRANDPRSASYTPSATHAFNWANGPIRITRPAGTTGRYVVTFTGLSALLGARNTVKVTGFGTDNSYCKPVTGYLASDKVEVRCYKGGTGTPVNARFTLLVTRAAADRAFALAHRPTATDYSPHSKGSWNPAGTMRVFRLSQGLYRVVFKDLRSQLTTPTGHVQATAVGSGKAHCTIGDWGETPDLVVYVQCYTPAGAPADSKFSVAYVVPAKHLAYAWAHYPTRASYTPDPGHASNPAGGEVSITRIAPGKYTIWWVGVDTAILGAGTVQVTDAGTSTHCKVSGQGAETAQVQCFGPTGTLVDSYYSVLLGS